MSEWKTYRIKDVAKVIGGGTPKTNVSEYWYGDIPWITPKDLTTSNKIFISRGERNITKLGLEESSAQLLPKGTVLLTSRAPIGCVAIASNKLATNQGFKSLICNEKLAYNVFIYYWLIFNKEYLNSIGTGTTFAEISGSVVKDIEISLPTLFEQKAIAGVLSSLDDKIDLLHRQNKTLEAMAETLFRQWFIEEAEDDWEEVPLRHVFDFLEGPGIRNWQYTDKGVPFINIRLINNNDIDISKANYVSGEEGNVKYAHFHLQDKDLVMSTSGTLGRTAIVRPYHLPMILNTSVIRFRPKETIGYAYMYQYLNSIIFQEELRAYASGSVQLNFGPTHLKMINIALPPSIKLEQYELRAKPLYDKIANNQLQIKSIEQIRNTLLPKLMSGEIRVESE